MKPISANRVSDFRESSHGTQISLGTQSEIRNPQSEIKASALNVAFLHPDLGIGGAERLVVDAASVLQAAGHRVTLFTTHHDPERCFEETRNGALDVHVYGDFLPMHVGQRLRAPCAILRTSYAALAMALRHRRFDVVFSDLVAHVIPLLRLITPARIIFYCHFPDLLLAPVRGRPYQWYRWPIDRLEEMGVRMADRVLVNSRFTSSALLRAFPRLALVPEVLYPGVDVSRYPRVAAPDGNDVDGQNGCIPHLSEARELEAAGRLEKSPAAQGASAPFGKGGGERSERGIWARCRRDGRDVELRGTNWECTRQNFLILSLSRYEPKKNLGLAIDAVACLRRLLPPDSFSGVRLVIAGGYDQRLRECSETLRSLETQARQLGIESQVTFACSPTDAERIDLLSRCSCVVYTPVEEHFGYVPLEAMAAGRPVVAANRGGPVETIVDGGTGFLCDPTPEAFAGALLRLLGEPGVIDQMGRAGRAHVQEHFSMTVFGQRIEKILRDTVVRG